MNLAQIHHLATWTPAPDSFEYNLEQINASLERLGQRLDRVEAGADSVQATTDHIVRILQGGAR